MCVAAGRGWWWSPSFMNTHFLAGHSGWVCWGSLRPGNPRDSRPKIFRGTLMTHVPFCLCPGPTTPWPHPSCTRDRDRNSPFLGANWQNRTKKHPARDRSPPFLRIPCVQLGQV